MSVVGQRLDGLSCHLVWGVGLGPGDFVFDGDQAPPKKGTTPTKFLAHVYCGQNGWTDQDATWYGVNLGPGDVVLDGVTAPTSR